MTPLPPEPDHEKCGNEGEEPYKRAKHLLDKKWDELLNDDNIRMVIRKLTIKNPFSPIICALTVYGSILAALLLIGISWRISPVLAILVTALAAPLAALGYRGIENLVHGAAHYDLLGTEHAWLNDCISDLMFASQVFQTTANFRRGHMLHHGRFGSDEDPCRKRMQANANVRSGKLPTAFDVLKGVPSDAAAFYRLVGSKPATLISGLVWHGVIYVLPLALALGWKMALVAWASLFVPVFGLLLPVVRALAEAAKHDYAGFDRAASKGEMLNRTFNHEGLLNAAFHLFGDAYHLEHHALPQVPQYRLAKLHQLLLQHEGYRALARQRGSVLSVPDFYKSSVTDDRLPANDNMHTPANDNDEAINGMA